METDVPALRSLLEERIRSRGPIPFAEFMETVLYHPAHGYYCRPGASIGARGDFYTSADVHPAFGLLIARQIAELADRVADKEGPFHVIEAGPGTGRLARDIIAGLAAERPGLAARTTVTLVEVSPALRAQQRATIARAGSDGPVREVRWAGWGETLERRGLDAAGEGLAAVVVANEFLDALPVHVVQMTGGALREVHVGVGRGGFEEVLGDPVDPRLEPHLAGLDVALEEGQRAEIGLRALDWVGSLGTLFGRDGRGGAILIDYGHPARELYSPARHAGTLMCYHRHRAAGDPYTRVGRQDITAHVDLTSVRLRALAAGFDVAPPVSQMKFLVALGLASMLAERAPGSLDAARDARDRLALHALMTPGGMGEIFKAVLLARGTPARDLTGAIDPFRGVTAGEAR